MPLKEALPTGEYPLYFLTCGPALLSSADFQIFLKSEFKTLRVVTTKETGDDGYIHFHAILRFGGKVRWLNMNKTVKNWLSRQPGIMDQERKVNTDWRHGGFMKNAEAVMEKYITNPSKIKMVGDVMELESLEKELFDKLILEWMHKCSKSDFREMYQNCSASTKQLPSVKAVYDKFYGTCRKRKQLSAYELARDRMRIQESMKTEGVEDILAKIQRIVGPH